MFDRSSHAVDDRAGSATPSTPEILSIDLETVQARMARAMSAFVGQGKPWSIEALSAETGIAVTNLKEYRRGIATPGTHNLLRLIAVLGPEFTDMLLALAGLGNCARIDGERADVLALNAAICRAAGGIAASLERRDPEHVEGARIEPEVRALAAACNAFLAHYAAHMRSLGMRYSLSSVPRSDDPLPAPDASPRSTTGTD